MRMLRIILISTAPYVQILRLYDY